MGDRLAGKSAIVTGAASGMGAAEGRLFAREGARVILADVLDDLGEAVAAEIRAAGGEALYARADVSAEADWEALIAAAEERHGGLDVLVNNAGLSSTSEADPASTEGWERIIAVNATGTFLGCKHGAEAMARSGRPGGSIVNISSIYGLVGSAGGHPAYHASKAAVRNLSKAMAVRLAPRGIRVNSVHPGFMPPMRSGAAQGEEALARLARAIPLGRTGEVDEVANAVLFLASDEASYVTGAELAVDGGFTAK